MIRCSIEYGYTCPNYENRKAKREICENCKFKTHAFKTFVECMFGGKKIVEPVEEVKKPKKEKWFVRLARFLIKKYGE